MTINRKDLDQYLKDTGQMFHMMQKLGGLYDDEGRGQPCPFCGGEDRLWYSEEYGKCYCRKCMPDGKGCSIYDLVMHKYDVSFPEALALIAEASGFEISTDRQTIPSPPQNAKPEEATKFHLSELVEDSYPFTAVHKLRPEIDFVAYKRAGAVVFSDRKKRDVAIPMFGNDGNISGYVRYHANGGKPMISKGSKSGIVGVNAWDALWSKRQVGTAVIKCAGVSDYLTLSQLIVDCGLDADYYVFTNGAGEGENPSKFDPALRPALEGQSVFVIADNDDAGVAGAQKWAGHLATYADDVRILHPPRTWDDKPIKDLRDFVASAGVAAVLDWLRSAPEQAEPVEPNKVGVPFTKAADDPILVRVSEVEEKEIVWLWLNKIALGMLSLITGLAGIGKSFWTVYMTAIITTGRDWADGTPCEKGSVLFFYGEEGIADTYKKRFRANGANQDNVVFMKGKLTFDEKSKKLSEDDVTLIDVVVIEKAIKETAEKTGLPVKMVVIDPISNYWGAKTNENSNADVRSNLRPMQLLAEKMEVAFVMIQHTGKGDKEHAQQQVLGSTGIVAICRAVWGISVDPNDRDKRLFSPMKVNCGYDHTAVSYRIVPPDGTVEIVETGIRKTADDVLDEQRKARESRGRKPDIRNDCEDRMLEILADGRKVQSTDIKTTLRSEGFRESMINTVKRELGVKSIADGGKGRFWWLPPDSEVADAAASEIENAD